ncbi:hypothetical protein BD560DRAFT_493895 [Blakeslea trispora]|nr:hypothetical protein BD560DRAFT_493895 [Blakeslea trispora]
MLSALYHVAQTYTSLTEIYIPCLFMLPIMIDASAQIFLAQNPSISPVICPNAIVHIAFTKFLYFDLSVGVAHDLACCFMLTVKKKNYYEKKISVKAEYFSSAATAKQLKCLLKALVMEINSFLLPILLPMIPKGTYIKAEYANQSESPDAAFLLPKRTSELQISLKKNPYIAFI